MVWRSALAHHPRLVYLSRTSALAQGLQGVYRAVVSCKHAMDATDWRGGSDHVFPAVTFVLGPELGATEEHVVRRSRVGVWAGIGQRASRI